MATSTIDAESEAVIRHFAQDASRDLELIEIVVANMFKRPMTGVNDGDYMRTAEEAIKRINHYGLCLNPSRYGWIDPDGRFYGCVYSGHDQMIYWLGLEVTDVEKAGWVHYSNSEVQHEFRLTSKQISTLRRQGFKMDEETKFLNMQMPNLKSD